MKRLFLLSTVAMLLSVFALDAQSVGTIKAHRHEFKLGVGAVGTYNVFTTADVFDSVEKGGKLKNDGGLGANIWFGYKYAVSPIWSIGISAAYSDRKKVETVDGIETVNHKRKFTTFAIETDIRYYQQGLLTVYGSAGLGTSIVKVKHEKILTGVKDKTTVEKFNMQLSPVGVRLGTRFGFFAEVGFGYKGLINGGLYARF